MAGGIQIGGAYFELTASSAGLIQALTQAEQASKKSVQQIAQATGQSEKDVQRLATTWIAAEQRRANASAQATLRIIKAHNDAADAAQRAASKQAQSNDQALASVLGLAKGFAGFAAAATGVTVGAASINKAMTSIAESTQKAAQAQFALNALYGATAPLVTKQAEDLAKASGRSRTEALEAATAVANLGRQYALTGAQQKQVLDISANLAAIRGISLEEATKRVSDALRGEAEAAEYLGQALNSDAVKAFANMTDEQRKNFETLSPITKAQIVLGKLIGDNADLMGKAAERANTATGAYDKFTASIDNLSVSIGQRFTPAVVGALKPLTQFVDTADAFVKSDFVDRLGKAAQIMAAIASLDVNNMARAFAIASQVPGSIQVGPDPGLPGSGPGTTPDQAQAIKDADAARRQFEAAQKDALAQYVKAQKQAIDDVADAREKAARKAAQDEDDRIEQAKIGLEVEKAAKLKALDETERATIKALEDERQAAKDASDEAIKLAELQKQAQIDAVDAAYDALQKAVKRREDDLAQLRDAEDRATEDRRQAVDREIADQRKAEDDLVEAARQRITAIRDSEDRDRQDRRQAEDRELDERRQKEDRELDERARRLDARRQAEDRDRQDRRQAEDRAIRQQRAAEDKALDDAAKARDAARQDEDRKRAAGRQQEDRDLADRRAAEDRALEEAHQAQLDRIATEHESRLAALDDEAQSVRDTTEQESRARETAHTAVMRQFEAEHDAILRNLDDEAEAVRDAAEQESRAREAAHQAAVRAFEAEADAARQAHDDALRAIDEQKQAEDDRHREAIDNIEAEGKARLDEIDRQLGLLDAADEEDRRAAKDKQLQDAVTNAQFDLLKAQSSGNQSEIVRAQQALDDALAAITQESVKRERDAQRDKLRAQQDAIKAQIAAQKEAENERNRQRERELQADRRAADDRLAKILDEIAGRKQAEGDAYASATQDAQDSLDAVLGGIADRKQAEQDSYAAAKQNAQDAYAAIKEAADDARDAQLAAIADRRAAFQRSYDDAVERINDEFDLSKDRLSERRRDEDRAIDDRRQKEDQDRQDRRTKEDAQSADAKRRRDEQRAAEDLALADRRQKEDRDRSDRRSAQDEQLTAERRRITDRRHDEDVALADRRQKEDRDRSDRRTAEDLQAQAATKRISDRRTAEDRALADLRVAEDRERSDRRAAEDKALRDQLAAGQATREAERRDVEAHFNGPQGIITKLKAAQEEADRAYQRRLDLAKDKFRQEREAINETYRNPGKTGLLDLQDQAAENNARRLSDQLAAISAWKEQAGRFLEENAAKWKTLEQAINAVGSAIQGLPNSAPLGFIGGVPVQGPVAPGAPPSQGGGMPGGGGGSGGGNAGPPGGIGPIDPGTTGPILPDHEVENAIRNAFSLMGYQAAQDAVAVWSGEGRSAYVGDNGSSFGPFQLHMGGIAGGANAGGGLGDRFLAETGLDPRNPATWLEQVRWVRNYVRQNGWNDQWHGAPGYPGSGISNRTYAAGGWITEPVTGLGQFSGARYTFAEGGRPEYVTPRSRVPAMAATSFLAGASAAPYTFSGAAATGRLMAGAGPSVTIDLRGAQSFDGIKFEDMLVRALTRADARGRLTFLSGGA